MMTAGLKVIGALGTAQIDSNYRNFELISTGFITLTAGDATTRYADLSIPTGEPFPVLAIAGGYPAWSIMVSATVYRIYASVPNGVIPTLRFYIFGTPASSASGGGGIIGLRVRNPSTGNIAFSSERKYMKVLGRSAGTLAEFGSVSGNVAAGKTVAIAVQMRPYLWLRRTISQGQPIVTINIRQGRGVTSGASWTYDFFPTVGMSFTGNLPTLSYTSPYYSILIIDVTGY